MCTDSINLSNDPRFKDIVEKYPDINIVAYSHFTGWSWRASRPDHAFVSGAEFINDSEAVENCLEVMSGSPTFMRFSLTDGLGLRPA